MSRRTRALRRFRSVFEHADRLWDDAAGRTRPGELACRRGCFGCCVGLFEVSLAEAMLAREGVRKLPAGERREVMERARRIVDGTAAVFPGDAAAGLLDPDRSDAVDEDYMAVVAHTACPLLELPSGRCRIYAERPITCRTYGVAWGKGRRIAHPACTLNMAGAPPTRHRETAIPFDEIVAMDQRLGELSLESGFPGGVETTLAHALVGTAFKGM